MRRRSHRRDGRALRAGDDRRRAKFSATRVRFYFTGFALPLPPATRPGRGLALAPGCPPVPTLALAPPSPSLGIVRAVDAIHVPPITESAQEEHPPARVPSALNLPQIVHSTPRPQRTRPASGLMRQRRCRTRPLAATPGSERYLRARFISAVAPIVRSLDRLGQLRRQTELLRFLRISVIVYRERQASELVGCFAPQGASSLELVGSLRALVLLRPQRLRAAQRRLKVCGGFYESNGH